MTVLNLLITRSCFSISVLPVSDAILDETVQKFWEKSSVDTYDSNQEDEAEEVMKSFKETIQFDISEGRYAVHLPWKRRDAALPLNITMCRKRLEGLVKKLKKIGKLKEYDGILNDQRKRNFIERVDVPSEGKNIHYLPHFAVIREESKTTKLRVVYDASAKPSKFVPSLNDVLHTGPSLLPAMDNVLIK